MTATPRQLVVCALVACGLVMGLSTSAFAQSDEQINELVSTWQLAQAKKALDARLKADGSTPALLYVQARYDFFKGHYKEALGLLDQAMTNGTPTGRWKQLRDLIQATRDVTKDYVKYTSPKGRFEIYVHPGKDEVLVPFAGEALDRAYDVIGDELGYHPATPIRVEVYPRTATLAKVSSLTEKQIRTSGTIALCKYNRLMITSPKALLRGYPWVDTVVHEFTHFVINSKTHNRVPIWMHEGLAKFLERRWRGPDAHRLPPSSESLLAKRIKSGKLITFKQMHPSMALLPSQEDAAVAFAEVYTVMEYLQQQVPDHPFKKLLDNINSQPDPKTAFAKTIGEPFGVFEKKWMAYLETRKMAHVPDTDGYKDKLVFKDEDKSKNDLEVDQPQARDHIHLGEMLQARKRPGAALVEYKKAAHLLGHDNPVLQTRQAQCLLKVDKAKQALKVLQPVRDTYPSYVQSWIEMGHAALALGHYDDARDYLREAARLNPFDPDVFDKLAEAYDKLGNAKMAEKFRKFEKLVE